MTNKFEDLNNAFNVTGELVSGEVISSNSDTIESELKTTSKNIPDISDDIKKDYEYTRGNLYSLIEKGQEAINGILELAQESEMPRAYEVAGQLIKNVADATDKLMELQKKLKEVEEDTSKLKGPTNVTNALFVGSTAELTKLLKSAKPDNK
jgi:hypothetical protein